MIEIEVDRFPIVIVCSPRTGSTALLDHLCNKYKIPGIEEIFQGIRYLSSTSNNIRQNVLSHRNRYFEFINKKNSNYIIKLMPTEINGFSKYEQLLKSDCFKIRLQRNTVVDQIASFYIANKRKKFHHHDNEIQLAYTVEIDMLILTDCIERITHSNFLCKNLPFKYDYDLFYEQIGFIPDTYTDYRSSNHVYNRKPDNYEEICEEIKKLIGDNPC